MMAMTGDIPLCPYCGQPAYYTDQGPHYLIHLPTIPLPPLPRLINFEEEYGVVVELQEDAL